MQRGRLYEKDYQLKLSGHETFPLRYGWLKKAFDAVAEEESRSSKRSVFLADDAIARFGVGRNMVGSMRHWATAVGVIADDGGKTTRLGRFLFDARRPRSVYGRSGRGMACSLDVERQSAQHDLVLGV